MTQELQDKRNLFVGNFSWNLTQENLEELFASYGELESVKLIIDKATGRSKGFGFVKFVNEEDAEKALEELNGQEVDGREIRVTVAIPREERPRRSYNSEEY